VTDLREAAGIEGLIVLGVIYFILNILQKAGKKAAGSRPDAPPPDPSGGESATQQEALSLERILKEIEKVKAQHQPDTTRSLPTPQAPRPLPQPTAQSPAARKPPTARERPAPAARKREVPRRGSVEQSDRGPLGRHSRSQLPGAEEVEVRTTWEDQGSLEVEESIEVLDDTRLRPPRVEYDADEGAEEVVRRRIVAAESRNRALNAADHEAFDQRRMKGEVKAAAPVARFPVQRLRDAFIWREVLGPPKALEE
jgi:hypothetical protein